MAKWQFQDFCKENPRNNEEFRRVVEKMIMAEEKMREGFPDRNNRENNRDNLDWGNFPNIGHSDRRRRPDNTVAMADKTKKILKIQEVQRHREYALYMAPTRKSHNRRLLNLH
jgi:hypothetical protein